MKLDFAVETLLQPRMCLDLCNRCTSDRTRVQAFTHQIHRLVGELSYHVFCEGYPAPHRILDILERGNTADEVGK